MTISEVEKLEDRLRQAMLASDVEALDGLLSDRLLFVTPDGMTVGKADDLAAHRDGVIRLTELTPFDQRVEIHGNVAVVNVGMNLAGNVAGSPVAGRFRYTRVWCDVDGKPRIIAGQVCAIAQGT